MADDLKGKVTRIFPTRSTTRINIAHVATGQEVQTGTEGNYLDLDINHPNYSSLFSLLMASAVNKLPLIIWVDADGKSISQAILDFP